MRKIVPLLILSVIAIYFTPKILARLSLFFSGDVTKVVQENEDRGILLPPILESVPQATNSAEFAVKGFSQEAGEVEIYVNDILKKTASTNSKGDFDIEVNLFVGDNKIRAKSIDSNGVKSEFSKEIEVTYKKAKPILKVDQPEDGKHFSGDDKKITISGKTDPENELRINDRWAVVNSNGNFYFQFSLSEGENKLKIVVRDLAGNTATIDRTVTYSP